MTLQVEFWHLVTLAGGAISTFVGAYWALVRMLLAQLDKRFGAIERATRALEREHLELRAELPRDYLRREDAVRETAVVHAKLDSLAARIEMLGMKLVGGIKQ